jgi:hypothetical protein
MPKTEDYCGIRAFWKVRVMDLITDSEHGDNIGFVDWPSVTAVIWRQDLSS